MMDGFSSPTKFIITYDVLEVTLDIEANLLLAGAAQLVKLMILLE